MLITSLLRLILSEITHPLKIFYSFNRIRDVRTQVIQLSSKMCSPTHQHLHPPDHLPDIRSILPSAESVPSPQYPLGIHDTPVPPQDAEREKYEGRDSLDGEVVVILTLETK